MDKTFFSINDLINFCKSKKCYNFSAKTPEDRIKIREIGMFNAESEGESQTLSVKLKSCHVGRNLNQSFISKDSMLTAMPSFKGKPILGAIVQNEDTKEFDFNGHDMELYEDENGETQIKYIEQIIGNISEVDEPHLEYDKDQDKDFVVVKGKIFKEYTKAEEILKRRKSCACSVELSVQDLSYNTKEDCIELNAFTFMGVTLLGESVKPGMAGSNLVVESFIKNDLSYQEKLIETLERLNMTLENFNKDNEEKGVEKDMNHFEELLEQYGYTADELDFDYSNMNDEELDAAFEDFACRKKKCSENEENSEIKETEACGNKKKKCEEESEDDTVKDESGCKKKKCGEEDLKEEPEVKENNACGKKRKKCSVDENGDMTVEFSISHEEIRTGLYSLLMELEEIDNDYYYIRSVYDTNFIYEGWMSGKLYRQSYTKDGDNISLGDRAEVFEIIVTAEEKDALEKLKKDYAALVEFKQDIDHAQLKAKKDAVFARTEYSVLAEDEGFKALITEAEKYSVEECENKADVMFAKYCKSHGEFAAKEEKKTSKIIAVNFAQDNDNRNIYGGLFDDFKKRNKR